MGVSLDGFIQDRDGDFNWSVPSDEQFGVHLEEVGSLGAYLLGRRLYETMLVWETQLPRGDELGRAFAEAWRGLPKVVFSRTLASVEGNARLADGSLAEEVARTTGELASIGGADLAAQAIEQGLVDELRMFRYPVVVGGGTPYLPPVTEDIPLHLLETRTFDDRVILERYGRA